MRVTLFLLSVTALGACILHAGCNDADGLLVEAPDSPIRVTGSAMAAGDVNADGIADLLLVVDERLAVYFGGRSRSWTNGPNADTDISSKASEIALADVNEDGDQDVVLADHNSYDVAIWLGSGDARFTQADGSPIAAREGNRPHTHGLAVADVNGDGRLDIVTVNNNDGDASLLLGEGRGHFVIAPQSPFPCGNGPYPIAASDLNADGCADVLIPNAVFDATIKTLTILVGSSRGDLTPALNSPLVCDATVWYAAAGDLNGDKRPDVVATHSEGGSGASVFLNAGHNKFTAAPGSPIEFGHGAWGVEIADMNGDRHADLVVAADRSIRVMLGDGAGQFTPAVGSPFRTGKGAWRLVVADFNGDGKPDVATRCVEANRVEVFLGNLSKSNEQWTVALPAACAWFYPACRSSVIRSGRCVATCCMTSPFMARHSMPRFVVPKSKISTANVAEVSRIASATSYATEYKKYAGTPALSAWV
jgi:hypothetical protein